jgi:pilus assembly protein CpaF
MVGMAGIDLNTKTMRSQIASALHVVLQLQRMSDGKRKLVSFYEITGMEGEVITMQEIFRFVRLKTDAEGKIHGEFRATGIRPKFVEQLVTRGIELSPEIFAPNKVLG